LTVKYTQLLNWSVVINSQNAIYLLTGLQSPESAVPGIAKSGAVFSRVAENAIAAGTLSRYAAALHWRYERFCAPHSQARIAMQSAAA